MHFSLKDLGYFWVTAYMKKKGGLCARIESCMCTATGEDQVHDYRLGKRGMYGPYPREMVALNATATAPLSLEYEVKLQGGII